MVLTLRTLRTFFGNFGPKFEETWAVPFEVRSLVPGGPAVILFDDPLPRRALTAREKKHWYMQLAAKALLLQPWWNPQESRAGGGSESPPRRSLEARDDEDLFAASEDLSVYETFAQVDGAADTEGSSSDEDRGLQICEDSESSQSSKNLEEAGNANPRMTRAMKERLLKMAEKATPSARVTRSSPLPPKAPASPLPTPSASPGRKTRHGLQRDLRDFNGSSCYTVAI